VSALGHAVVGKSINGDTEWELPFAFKEEVELTLTVR